MQTQLALHGGVRAIPENTILPSPPTTPYEEALVLKSLRSGQHAWGENCALLQTEWAQWNGNRHCIALTSGTAALHMALVACRVQAGDEVITPAYSWTSSATCILHHNAIPVFVDIDPIYANIDPQKMEAAITPRTRAIIVVHLHGVPAPMDEILEVARRHGLYVIEDACQAHGARYRGRKVGTIGDAAAFSLNQNKMLSAGEGGLFVCDDEVMTERGRSLVLFGDFFNVKAGEALKVIASTRKPMENPRLHCERSVVEIAMRPWPNSEEPWYPRPHKGSPAAYYQRSESLWPQLLAEDNPVPVHINALRLGDAVLCTNPAELFVEFGLQIKERSPAKVTFVGELTDGYVGYVPTQKAFSRGGYETWPAPSSRLDRNAGEQIVSVTEELLRNVFPMEDD
jgi:hypothetical protein